MWYIISFVVGYWIVCNVCILGRSMLWRVKGGSLEGVWRNFVESTIFKGSRRQIETM